MRRKNLKKDNKIFCVANEPLAVKTDELSNNNFMRENFHRAILTELKICNSEFHTCDFRAAQMIGASVSFSAFNNCNLAGLEGQYLFFENNFFKKCIFRGGNITYSVIRETEFKECRFEMVDLRMADISTVKFIDCSFQEIVYSKSTSLPKGIHLDSNWIEKDDFDDDYHDLVSKSMEDKEYSRHYFGE